MRNIEIKAKVKDINKLIELAKSLSKSSAPEVIIQHDTFYNATQGRLKLRRFENGTGQLIQYDRTNTEGPKLSSYEKAELCKDDMGNVHNVLSKALGVAGDVKKMRRLFLVGQTRIHIDTVENLGDFMELEVVLESEDTIEKGQGIASSIMKSLNINEEDLLSGAYVDLLLKKV